MSNKSIQVIDLGISNLASLQNALGRVGADWEVVTDADKIGKESSAVILPGVGAFSAGMDALNSQGISEALRRVAIEEKISILGLCLGMQLLFDGSHEYGSHEGLGLIPGWVKPLPQANKNFRVPNIGWCDVSWTEEESVLANSSDKTDSFYFVHSLWCDCKNDKHVTGSIDFQGKTTAVVEAENIMGTQFHPEKSSNAGLELLSRFINFAKKR